MRILHHFEAGGIELAVGEFELSFDKLAAMCGDSSLAEYASEHFTNEKRRCQWLASRMLLKEILGRHITVCNRADGKPYLLDSSKHISISHTDRYVAVAVHGTCDVGVDIEMLGSKAVKVRRRFMSDVEEAALDKGNELAALLIHWSAKESFYKIVGNTGGSYRANFFIGPFKVNGGGAFAISYMVGGVLKKQCMVNYLVCKDFVLTFCADCANLNNV